MNEILFRVWDKETKKMELVGALDWDGDYKIITCNTETTKLYNDFNVDTDFILMQYTGVKDEKGVKIFTDDIVLARSVFTDKRYPFRVSFSGGSYWLSDYELLHKTNSILDTEDWVDLEVIGNFWQHPELIKEEAVDESTTPS